MALDLLPGNEQLKQKLAPALRADRLSHAYILSGPAGSGKQTLATLLAAAMECTAGESRPCCVCSQCRKVLSGTHPDVITVDDLEHKTVSVKVVRDARGDLFVKPNEGRRKVYIFPRAAEMGAPGQNALLKVLEEPPQYGSFLLLTDNAEKLLETIRSRCVELQLTPPQQIPRGLAPQTQQFAAAFAARDELALCRLLVPMEKLDRDTLGRLLTEWIELLSDALAARSGAEASFSEAAAVSHGRSGAELLSAIRRLQTALTQLDANVNPGVICGALQVLLR